jgi:hypothetical protein
LSESIAAPWTSTAAYLYALRLDAPFLAWEYLRRNPDYQSDWLDHPGECHLIRCRWGLAFAEDPTLDARQAQPVWVPDPEHLIGLVPAPAWSSRGDRFSLWAIPGAKRLTHDGSRILLSAHSVTGSMQLAIDAGVSEDSPYAYAVLADERAAWRWQAIEAHRRKLIGTRRPPPGVAWPVDRIALMHMRSLQALDGIAAGASQRAIAMALFGMARVLRDWHADSDVRAQTRHLIDRGNELVRGGYRRLLTHATPGISA